MSTLDSPPPADKDEIGTMSVSSSPPADDMPSPEVTELRTSLATAQEALKVAETRVEVTEAELQRVKSENKIAIATKEAVQQQLRDEIVKREAAEDKVELLRGQVEQARRSVMALQKQDQERAAIRAASGTGGPPPELSDERPKRASIYGRGRPTSTLSVTSDGAGDGAASPPPASGLRELRLGGVQSRSTSMAMRLGTEPPPRAKSPSAQPPRVGSADSLDETIDKDKPPVSPGSVSTTGSLRPDRAASMDSTAGAASHAAFLAAQAEISTLRHQLEVLSIQFAESEEARIASDSCVKALREFIATDPNDGVAPEKLKLPPLPTDKEADDDEDKHEQPAQKWGFGGLFSKAPGSSSASTSSTATVTAPTAPVPGTATSATSTLPLIEDEDTVSAKSPPLTTDSFSPPLPQRYPTVVDEDMVIAPAPPGGGLGRSLSNFFGRRRASRASATTASARAAREALAAAVEKDEEEAKEAREREFAAMESAGLGLEIDGITLPPPPSAPDVEFTLPTPTSPLRAADAAEEHTELGPSPLVDAHSPASSTISINSRSSRKSPAGPRSPARSSMPSEPVSLATGQTGQKLDESALEAAAESPVSPQSPPAASFTTNEDDLATPADSPIPETNGFAKADGEAQADEVEGAGVDTLGAAPPKPARAPQRSAATRGSRRGRGARRGAA